ncbi:MAG: tetratricopeptide repeat protein [Planctomycetia bacterium]|nr:tetratricopeptide repeat protein [Planctomycetia bacterium]
MKKGDHNKNTEGVVYYQQGQYDQALAHFQEAIRLNPNNADAYYNLASTYQKQSVQYRQPALQAQAENYYRACLDHNPNPETTVCCYRGIATIMNQRNQGVQAEELLKSWGTRNPNSLDPKLELAYLYEAQGKNREALASLQEAGTLAPNDYRVYYKTGVIQQKLGQPQAALDQFLMAGRLNPSDSEIANRITLLRSQVGSKTNSDLLAAKTPGTSGSNWKSASSNPASTVPALPGSNSGNSGNTGNINNTPAPAISMVPPDFSKKTPSVAQTTSSVPGSMNIQKTSAATSAAPNNGASGSGTFPTYTNSLANTTPAAIPNKPAAQASVPKVSAPQNQTAPKIPDGTGVNPFDLSHPAPVQTAAVPAPASTAPGAAASTAPSLPSTPTAQVPAAAPAKIQTIGNGPPRLSVGSGL